MSEIIEENSIIPDLKARDKNGVLEELAEVISNHEPSINKAELVKVLVERERLGSTGIGDGVAIPHGKTDAVTELLACVGIVKEGVDFKSLDGVPGKIFIMTLSPSTRSGPHVQFLADISRVLTSEGMRDKLINAETKDELLSLIVKRPS